MPVTSARSCTASMEQTEPGKMLLTLFFKSARPCIRMAAYHSPLRFFLRRRIGGTPIATGSATNSWVESGQEGGMVLPTDGVGSNL